VTYQPNRLTIGYQHAHVLNPQVFADLRQPQRQRGFVSPLVYQTTPPTIYHPNLSGVGAEEVGAAPVMAPADEQLAMQRASFAMQRESSRLSKTMAIVAIASAVVGVAGLSIALYSYSKRR